MNPVCIKTTSVENDPLNYSMIRTVSCAFLVDNERSTIQIMLARGGKGRREKIVTTLPTLKETSKTEKKAEKAQIDYGRTPLYR